MITIQVDEGHAFDFLSIYDVKRNKFPSEQSNNNYDLCAAFIIKQINENKYGLVMNSIEYWNLYNINTKLFELVDAVKKNPCLGGVLDQHVLLRYQAKVALQKKWFPEVQINEQKIGY